MPDLVYLMMDAQALRFSPDVANDTVPGRLPFAELAAQMERTILGQYGQNFKVNHALLDVKFPLLSESIEDGKMKACLREGDPDLANLPGWGERVATDKAGLISLYEIERYRTIALSQEDTTTGNLIGYSLRDNRPEKLATAIRVYTARGEYKHLSRKFNPPFFALTSMSVDEVKEAFEKNGLEVKLLN